MVTRPERHQLAERVLHLLLGARRTGQRAAAWAAFKDLYGGSTSAMASGPGAAARLAELLPVARRREILERHIAESRLTAVDEEHGYRAALGMLAEHIDGPFDAIRDLLDDMLRNGPDPLRELAETILLRVGDDAWQLWPAIREAMRRQTRRVAMRKGGDPLAEVVTDCVRRQPARLKAVEQATWESFDRHLVAVLRDLGPLAAPAAPLLALILADLSLDDSTRRSALEGLGAVESQVPDALDAILAAINDDSDDIAELAMSIAARRRLDPARFVPALLARVNDTSWSSETYDPGAAARKALGAYGVEPPPPPAPPAVPPRPAVAPTPAQVTREHDRMAAMDQSLRDFMRGLEDAAEARGRKRSGPAGIRRKARCDPHLPGQANRGRFRS